MSRLPRSFYTRTDVVRISRELLGKRLCSKIGNDEITGGIIIETEAYAGATDRASHAYGNRRTKRTEVMFHEGGVAYVYFCYGMHSLFNVVTNVEGIPDAVLIRAIQPTRGIATILKRRGMKKESPRLSAGPGTLTKALGIDCSHTGTDLLGKTIWIENGPRKIKPSEIIAGPRVGVDYAGPDAKRPWRFRIAQSI